MLPGPALAFLLDYLPSPALLVAYLDYREEMTARRQVHFSDEDDLLCAFLLGLDVTHPGSGQPTAGLIAAPFLDAHLRRYEQTHPDNVGDGSAAVHTKKLRKRTSRAIRVFVDRLERDRPGAWLEATSVALRTPLRDAQQAERTHLRPGDQFRLAGRTLLLPVDASHEALRDAVGSASEASGADSPHRYFLISRGRKREMFWAGEWRGVDTLLPHV